jgi:mxaK protein
MALTPSTAVWATALRRAGVSRHTRRGLLVALALLALAAALDGAAGWRVQRWNAQIRALAAAPAAAMPASGAASGVAAAGAAAASASGVAALPWDEATAARVPELQFAHAHALADLGLHDAAINRYGLIPADTAVGRAARFNSANVLLRQGMVLREGAMPGQALALIELAKEGYRELLRHDPQHWPARYNLDRAQRLVPDPDEATEEPPAPPRAAERAATTMRGYSPGMP